jgi:hypothetical protein
VLQMETLLMTDTHAALDPGERLIYGADIDADLGISDRGRRKLISSGRLPGPSGYLGGKGVWRLKDYLAARQRLLASGRPRRPGAAEPTAAT